MSKKPKVVFISHLKPAEDVRGCYKMAGSLGKEDLEIHIIGPGIQLPKCCMSVQFHLTGEYRNGLTGRIMKLWKALIHSVKLKPDIIIPNHTELLYVAIANKILFGAKIGYDVQENTAANARYAEHLPTWKKAIAYLFYSVSEQFAKLWIDQYYIAEVIYKQELRLPSAKTIDVLNTFKPVVELDTSRQAPDKYRLLYCGTIARVYGIFQAIQLTKQLHQINANYNLVIIGFTSDKLLLKELKNTIKDLSFIQLNTDSFPIPYPVILNEMRKAGMVLMPYQKNKAIQYRIPTKWYECLAMRIPMLIAENDLLESLPFSDDAAIFHSFKDSEAGELYHKIHSKTFYRNSVPKDAFWNNDGKRFEAAVRELLSK